MQTQRSRASRRRGATTIETAIVLPVAILLILGILEYARYIMILVVANNAARAGARVAMVNCNSASTLVLGNMTDPGNINPLTIRGLVNGQMAGLQHSIDDPTQNTYRVYCFVANTDPTKGVVGVPADGYINDPPVGGFAYPPVGPSPMCPPSNGLDLTLAANANDWQTAPFGQAICVVVWGKYQPIFLGVFDINGSPTQLMVPQRVKAVSMMNSEG